MIPATNDSLARAITYLGAVEVAPGRYAFPSKVEPRWFTCDVENIALCEPAAAVYFAPIDAGRSFFGCKLTPCVLMPSWWSPERKSIYRFPGDSDSIYDYYSDAVADFRFFRDRMPRPGDIELVTADLETGAEVPC